MYKKLNRVFSKKKHAKHEAPPDGPASPDGASLAAPKAGGSDSARPTSPLRLGSPSMGEATVKKVVKRLFYPDGFPNVHYAHPLAGSSTEGAAAAAPAGGATAAAASSGDVPVGPTLSRPKEVPTEMLAFEIGSIMRRMLEIHDSMSEKMLSSLRSNLQAPGVVTLIANDLRVLWGLAGYEKQQELRLVACRVAVLGRKCNDQRLRKLRVLFDELDSPSASFQDYSATPQEADMLVRFMREQAEATDTLKSEMESIQLLHTRIQEYGEWNSLQEMVTQGKMVEKLQGHCLWSYNLDYLVQVLVIALCSLRKRIFASFGSCDCPEEVRRASLGEAGLALHYANVVVLLERIIQQPDTVLGPTRDELYGMLPRNIQYLLRVQLQDPLNFTTDGRIEANLKRGLLLLPTMAHNTISWHSRHTPGASLDSAEAVFQVQTFYYANRASVNAALVDVLLGLCRICGVENPIGFVSVQSSATADQKTVLAKMQEEEGRAFKRNLGVEDRDNRWGGEVTKVVDVREARREEGQGGAGEGGKAAEGTRGGSQERVGDAAHALHKELQEIDRDIDGEEEASPDGSTSLHTMARSQSARLSEDISKIGKSKEDPIVVARTVAAVDVTSGAVARRLIAGKDKATEAPAPAKKKSNSQMFVKGGGAGAAMAGNPLEVGRSWSARSTVGAPSVSAEFPMLKAAARVEASAKKEAASSMSTAMVEHPGTLRRVLPAGGLVGCFAPQADSDSEDEGSGDSRSAKARRGPARDFSVKQVSMRFGQSGGSGSSPRESWSLRKTKHYHSQPLARPRADL